MRTENPLMYLIYGTTKFQASKAHETERETPGKIKHCQFDETLSIYMYRTSSVLSIY